MAAGVAGERLTDVDVDTILKLTGTEEDLDGNIKYEGLFACDIKCSRCLFAAAANNDELKPSLAFARLCTIIQTVVGGFW